MTKDWFFNPLLFANTESCFFSCKPGRLFSRDIELEQDAGSSAEGSGVDVRRDSMLLVTTVSESNRFESEGVLLFFTTAAYVLPDVQLEFWCNKRLGRLFVAAVVAVFVAAVVAVFVAAI